MRQYFPSVRASGEGISRSKLGKDKFLLYTCFYPKVQPTGTWQDFPSVRKSRSPCLERTVCRDAVDSLNWHGVGWIIALYRFLYHVYWLISFIPESNRCDKASFQWEKLKRQFGSLCWRGSLGVFTVTYWCNNGMRGVQWLHCSRFELHVYRNLGPRSHKELISISVSQLCR